MGDVGDDFRAWDKHKKEKRVKNTEFSTQLLIDKGIEFKSLNQGRHLKIGTIDFWPSTGLIMEKGYELGRGYKKLLKILKAQS